MNDKANTRQVGGNHYSNDGLQHWDLLLLFNWDYFQGQVTKYLMRWRHKNKLQDLEKALHFLEKYVEAVKRGLISMDKDKHPTLPRAYWLAMLSAVDAEQARAAIDATAKRLAIAEERAALLDRFKGAINPAGWRGFTFEGSKDDCDMYKCGKCDQHFKVQCDTPPLQHQCPQPVIEIHGGAQPEDVLHLDRSEMVTGRHRDGTPVTIQEPQLTVTDGTEPGRTYVSGD